MGYVGIITTMAFRKSSIIGDAGTMILKITGGGNGRAS
jgi:hypothetical protein